MDETREIYMAYFRAWRDCSNTAMQNVASLEEIPAFIDLVGILANDDVEATFWQGLSRQIEVLHGKGIKVARTIFLPALYEDGHYDKELRSPLSSFSNDQKGYTSRAREIEEKYLKGFGYDGLIVDVDRNVEGVDLEKAAGVFRALSSHWGPASLSGRLLIFDHDILVEHPTLLPKVADLISYLFVDTYGMSMKHVESIWDDVQSLVPAHKFVPGFSFYEENGERWGDVSRPLEKSKAFALAQWQPSAGQAGKKGGVFAYAIDRDGAEEGDNKLKPTVFAVSQEIKKTLSEIEEDSHNETHR
ncbi:MAG: hypothetical protein LKI93_06180 [Bifidobacteriaceae bacterium]|jgi:hypothetical protein|nr:hypothetical protein [Bifidobacteriaceae bacterium]MCI1914831.1 hypothetical protein [Bifidobacteriaceae bacterium]